jgi:hypothetical protein
MTSHPLLTEHVNMVPWHRVRNTQAARRPWNVAPPTRSRTETTVRCVVAVGFVAAFIAIGIAGAPTACRFPVLFCVEACCLVPLLALVSLELRPVLIALWNRTAGASAVIRRFRHELDRLPEIPHPLGG